MTSEAKRDPVTVTEGNDWVLDDNVKLAQLFESLPSKLRQKYPEQLIAFQKKFEHLSHTDVKSFREDIDDLTPYIGKTVSIPGIQAALVNAIEAKRSPSLGGFPSPLSLAMASPDLSTTTSPVSTASMPPSSPSGISIEFGKPETKVMEENKEPAVNKDDISSDYILMFDFPGVREDDIIITHQNSIDGSGNENGSVRVSCVKRPHLKERPPGPPGHTLGEGLPMIQTGKPLSAVIPLPNKLNLDSMQKKCINGALELHYSIFEATRKQIRRALDEKRLSVLQQQQSQDSPPISVVSAQMQPPLPPPQPQRLQQPAAEFRLNQLRGQPLVDEKSTYDIVFNIADLGVFGRRAMKWDVKLSPSIRQKILECREKIQKPGWYHFGRGGVAVSGLFNRGKTWVLNRIAGLSLKSSNLEQTEGLSFKNPLASNLRDNILLIDSAGQYVPVKDDDNSWNNRTSTEGLLKLVLLDVASLHIVVVNELTWPDQLYIRDVQSHKSVNRTDVIVVHNLRHFVSLDQLKIHREQNVEKSYSNGRAIGFSKSPPAKALYPELYQWWQCHQTHTRHIFLLNDNIEANQAYNTAAVEELRTSLLIQTGNMNSFNIFDEIILSLNRHLPNYLSSGDVTDKPRVEFEPADSEIAGNSNPVMQLAPNTSGRTGYHLRRQPNPQSLVTPISQSDHGTPSHLIFDSFSEADVARPPSNPVINEMVMQPDSKTEPVRFIADHAEREKYRADHPAVNTYDIVFDINTLSELIKKNRWPIEFSRSLFERYKWRLLKPVSKQGFGVSGVVAVSGLFNRGKTFVLNRLAGLYLPEGIDLKTKGISFKKPLFPKIRDHVLLMDTAGQNFPVDQTDVNGWANRIGVERLIKQVVFDVANFHIIVVNELTWPDQIYIKEVADQVAERKEVCPTIFVIHNLKGLRVGDLEGHHKTNVEPYFTGLKRVPYLADPERFWYVNKTVRHLYLVNDKDPEGAKYNAVVFQDILGSIMHFVANSAPTNVVLGVVNSLQNYLPRLIQYGVPHRVHPDASPDPDPFQPSFGIDYPLPPLRAVWDTEEAIQQCKESLQKKEPLPADYIPQDTKLKTDWSTWLFGDKPLPPPELVVFGGVTFDKEAANIPEAAVPASSVAPVLTPVAKDKSPSAASQSGGETKGDDLVTASARAEPSPLTVPGIPAMTPTVLEMVDQVHSNSVSPPGGKQVGQTKKKATKKEAGKQDKEKKGKSKGPAKPLQVKAPEGEAIPLLNPASFRVKPISLPRGITSGTQSDDNIIPPHIVYDPTTEDRKFYIYVDVPGLSKKDVIVDLLFDETKDQWQVAVKGTRKSERVGGQLATSGLGPGGATPIKFGEFELKLPVGRLLFNPDSCKWDTTDGVLEISFNLLSAYKFPTPAP